MIDMIAQLRSLALNFWLWWRGELTLLFSLAWESWQSSPLRVIYVDQKGWTVFDHLKVKRQKTAYIPNEDLEGEIEIFAKPFKGRQCSATTIQLSRHLGLRRTIDLPVAAKADLPQLLYYEVDRLTPFCADDVYLTYRVIETNETRQQIRVDVAAVPKATINRAFSIAERHCLPIKRIELEGAQELDFSHYVQASADRSLLFGGLSSIVVFVCLASFAMAFYKILDQQGEIERLDSEILLVRSDVDTYSKKRQQYEHLAATAEFVESSKAGKLPMVEILAELTQLIPDQAYLVQLIIHHDTIQLYGFADKTSSLITVLEQSPIFTAPRFDSPVTMDSNAGRERFHLSVQTATGSR